MEDLIEELKALDNLELPMGNYPSGAVWLDDVLEVVRSHYQSNFYFAEPDGD